MFISSQTLNDDEILISFDVVSLFTKVSTDLAIQVARQRLLDDTSLTGRTSLTTGEITILLEFCLNATFWPSVTPSTSRSMAQPWLPQSL